MHLYITPNDLQTGNDLQIGPQMIPGVDLKWSRGKTKNGMKFVPQVEISIFYTKQKQALTDHILYRYYSHDKIVPRIDYHKSSSGCLVISFAYT